MRTGLTICRVAGGEGDLEGLNPRSTKPFLQHPTVIATSIAPPLCSSPLLVVAILAEKLARSKVSLPQYRRGAHYVLESRIRLFTVLASCVFWLLLFVDLSRFVFA